MQRRVIVAEQRTWESGAAAPLRTTSSEKMASTSLFTPSRRPSSLEGVLSAAE